MRVLREINKWLRRLGDSRMSFPPGIDSHKWANQMEIRHLTSSKPDVEVMATLQKSRTCIP